MSRQEHKLINITHDLYGWTGTCSCGRWGGVASSEAKLKRQHEVHLNDLGGGGKR